MSSLIWFGIMAAILTLIIATLFYFAGKGEAWREAEFCYRMNKPPFHICRTTGKPVEPINADTLYPSGYEHTKGHIVAWTGFYCGGCGCTDPTKRCLGCLADRPL